MKRLILLLSLLPTLCCAQLDLTQIVVNVSDNPLLQYNGAAVKQKATVLNYQPLLGTLKDFSITVGISCYINNAGAYGSTVISDIAAKLQSATITADQAAQLYLMYQDRQVTYTTAGQCSDSNGNIEACSVNGAIPEIQYWQTFTLTQVGVSSLALSAAQAQYKIITAIVNKLDSRKKW